MILLEYEDDDDSYEDDDDGSVRSGGTQYWSTGTAMETDYEDSINEDDYIDIFLIFTALSARLTHLLPRF